ncbi:dTDP-4-dehydrorhamnose 3,5-epimerase [Zavarzinia sp. CC-PAN008]|uniref:dTDP-4-dehydrorhamnose 3,5-epimerase n=1 Tax=Zavarzinia sp. CC-PAN008 TaxID=3243332 RepID=UPI003F748F92
MPAPLHVEPLALAGVFLLTPARFEDQRGWFSEVFSLGAFEAQVGPVAFIQDNQSLSRAAGTVRGLHFQHAPHGQAKLVRVLRGSILDVVVDIRPASPCFGRHVAVQLDARDGRQLFVPAGFAHGFCTLEADTEVLYKVDAAYAPDHDAGIHWRDPDLAIAWPIAADAATISAKDAALPRLRDLRAPGGAPIVRAAPAD